VFCGYFCVLFLLFLLFLCSATSPKDTAEVLADLDDSGYVVTDLSENEMAKVHGRYLCGGRSNMGSNSNELLYRFEFPERPGALKKFLGKSIYI
jgi:threonine dehydratase